MFIYYLVWYFLIQTSQATSDLESACESLPQSFYYGSSCFVASADYRVYQVAKHSCTQFENGHLTQILTTKTYDHIMQQMSGIPHGHYWFGLEQVDGSVEPSGGWAWTRPDGLVRPVPHEQFLWFWNPTEPDGVSDLDAGAIHAITGTIDMYQTAVYRYICEYEEPNVRTTCYSQTEGFKGGNGTEISTDFGFSRGECAKKCSREPVCSSFSYNKDTGQCTAHWTNGEIAGFEPVPEAAFEFFAYKL